MRHAVIAVAAAALLAACSTNPITGRESVQLVGTQQERQMGLRALRQELAGERVVTDPRIAGPVEAVGNRLVAAAGMDPREWRFLVVEDPAVNAYALPGGYVVVNTGMLPVAQDEAGLATVLSHEIGHVLGRHSGERVSRQVLTQLGIGVLSSALGGGGQLAQLMGAAASVGVNLPAARSQESEADYMGLAIMRMAGYDPAAAIGFWQRMQAATARRGRPPEFLSTHPSGGRRLEQIRDWLPEIRARYG